MTTPAITAQHIDGNDKSKSAGFGELDEAIAYDDPAESALGSSRVYFNFELFDLYRSPVIHIQRRLIDAMDGEAIVGSIDELLVWLNTTDVKLRQDSNITLEVDGQPFTIQPASSEQRLHLLFVAAEAPEGIGQGIDYPVRVDGNASRDNLFETTAFEHLFLYGTPQFQARVYEQLALLPGYPELKRLLDKARQQYANVPDIVLMQCYTGPRQQGPGFDLQGVIPAKYSHLLPGDYTAVLYDPYDANGLDGLTTLARMLQEVYNALAPDSLIPTPTQGN